MKDLVITQGRLAMPRGSVLRVQDGEGIALHVWSGSLWITQEGDRQDYYVGAGDAFSLDRGGLALVSATRRALVTMTTPATEDWAAGRIVLARAGSQSPVQIYPSARPDFVRRLLERTGLARFETAFS